MKGISFEPMYLLIEILVLGWYMQKKKKMILSGLGEDIMVVVGLAKQL